jgi:hypothetical protein
MRDTVKGLPSGPSDSIALRCVENWPDAILQNPIKSGAFVAHKCNIMQDEEAGRIPCGPERLLARAGWRQPPGMGWWAGSHQPSDKRSEIRIARHFMGGILPGW